MHTFFLDGSAYSTPRDLHAALKSMMALPDYYGMNADALNDCLSEMKESVNVWIFHPGTGEVAAALSVIRMVVMDNGGTVKEL